MLNKTIKQLKFYHQKVAQIVYVNSDKCFKALNVQNTFVGKGKIQPFMGGKTTWI